MKTVNINAAEDRAKELFPGCDELNFSQAMEFVKVLLNKEPSKSYYGRIANLFAGRSGGIRSDTKTPHEIVDILNNLRPDPYAEFYPHDGNGNALESYAGPSDRHITRAWQAIAQTNRQYNG